MTTRVLWCVTSPLTARAFLTGHLHHLQRRGISTMLTCSDDGSIGAEVPVFVPWQIDREPSAAADARALRELTGTLRRLAPDTVVVGTPKAALLGMLAAVAARVPRRVYVVHGLRFEGFTGARRRALQAVETLIATLSTDTVAVSPSVAERMRGLLPPGRRGHVRVLRHGSADGIDPGRFRPADAAERAALRERLELPTDGPVVLFIGRLTGDKGVDVLHLLAQRLPERFPGAVLVVVGEPEPRSEAEARDVEALLAAPVVRHVPQTDEVEAWMRSSDVLAQPTRREGMPNVILEAQFSGLPVVSCAVTGVVDAVQDDVTGVLVPWGRGEEFVATVLALLADPERRERLSGAALERARERYDQTALRDAWADLLTERS